MNPLIQIIKSAFLFFWLPLTYKKGVLLIFAIPFSLLMEFIYNGSFLGIGVLYIILFGALMMTDFFTGWNAARHKGEKTDPDKIVYTFLKAFLYVLFFFIMYNIEKDLKREGYWVYQQLNHGVNIFSFMIFTILALKEYVSIGDNIKKRFGKKPDIFRLVDRIATTIEDKLINKIIQSDIFNPKEKQDEPKN